jgi:hypothetical protein
MTERELRNCLQQYLDFMVRVSPQGKLFEQFLESRKFTRFRKFDRLESMEFYKMIERVRATPKQCYFNSQQATIMTSGVWKYYEGWVLSENLPLPIEHSWNVLSHQVLDLTLNPMTQKTPFRKDKLLYCGVNIPLEYVKKAFFKEKVSRALMLDLFTDAICLKPKASEASTQCQSKS